DYYCCSYRGGGTFIF
nr:immunoglobulin light chain junction region [Macaca mulatta]